jgi:hypothetical protein
MPHVPPQFLDNNGDPAASHLLFCFVAGTTTKQNTYSDQARTVANANPIVLDASGRATIFLLDASYKFVLEPSVADGGTDPPTNAIWTRDNVSSVPFYNIDTTIADGSATVAAWGTSDNTLQLTIPKHPIVISCIYDTPTDAINLPAGTLGTNDDCLILEWEADYGSADLDARATMFGTNVDLGVGAASTHMMARYVVHRQTNTAVQVSQMVSQNTSNILAQTNIGTLDLAATAYTIELTMASGSFNIRGHRITFIPALTDWTA